MIKRLSFTVVWAALLLASPASADHVEHDNEAEDLFTPLGLINNANLPAQAVANSGRVVALRNANGLRKHSLSFDLPGVGRLIADRQQQRESADGRTLTWVGKLRGKAGGMVSFTQAGDIISGFIDDGDRYWVVENAGQGRGRYRLLELDTSKTPPPAAPLRAANLPTTEESSSSTTQPAGATVIHDVLVAYTPEVTARYGGVAETEAAIANHVAAFNQAYTNSQVNIQLNLAGTLEVGQSQSGDMTTTLSRLRSTSDGYYDEVHPLRDQVGADLVAMLTTETGYCGVGYLNKPQNSGQDAWAFSITSAYDGYSCLPLTLGHEIGHNQGLCHNREETACSSPAYPYGFGYRVCGSFRTVMSYSCSGATRVYHFSNPNVTYGGYATGIAEADDPANSSEAWRALNDVALDVAAWRGGCAAGATPLPPSLLVAVAASHDQIDLEWVDEASNEAGFDIERSDDGQSWGKIASLGANAGSGGTVTYADSGLTANTTYSYRVSAHNCAGTSAAAGPESATTDSQLAAPPLAPAAVSATADANSLVTVQWDTVSNATSYEVGRADKTGRGNNWSSILVLGSTAVPSFDSDPGPGTYRYYVRASNAQGTSDWSSAAQVSVSDGSGGSGGCGKGKKKNCGS